MSAREAAIAAARHGWAVFPTRPGGKEPRRGLSWPSAATADPRRVAIGHWQPGENYGVAAKPSGLVIIDLDKPKPGYELAPRWRHWQDEPGIRDGRDVLATLADRAGMPWPRTFTVLTPTGGEHLYYRAPAGRNIGNKPLGPMVDIRGGGAGDGGYVLGPGSVLNGRRYQVADEQDPQPLPDWIADLLDPPQQAERTDPRRPRLLAAAVADSSVYKRMRGWRSTSSIGSRETGTRRCTGLLAAPARWSEPGRSMRVQRSRYSRRRRSNPVCAVARLRRGARSHRG